MEIHDTSSDSNTPPSMPELEVGAEPLSGMINRQNRDMQQQRVIDQAVMQQQMRDYKRASTAFCQNQTSTARQTVFLSEATLQQHVKPNSMSAANVDLHKSDTHSEPDTFQYRQLSQTCSMPGARTKSLCTFSDDCGTEYLSRRRKREGHSVDFQCMMSEAESDVDQCDSSPEQLNRKKKMLND